MLYRKTSLVLRPTDFPTRERDAAVNQKLDIEYETFSSYKMSKNKLSNVFVTQFAIFHIA